MSEFSPVGGSTLLLPEPADNTRRTGEAVALPAARVPSFKTGKSLRDAVNR